MSEEHELCKEEKEEKNSSVSLRLFNSGSSMAMLCSLEYTVLSSVTALRV